MRAEAALADAHEAPRERAIAERTAALARSGKDLIAGRLISVR